MTSVALIPTVGECEQLCRVLAQIAPYLTVAETPPEIHCMAVDGSPAAGATAADLDAAFPAFMDDWARGAVAALFPHLRIHPESEGLDWLLCLGPGDLLLLHEAEFLAHLPPFDRQLINAALAQGARLCNLTAEINPYASMDLARSVRPWDTSSPSAAREHLLEVLGHLRAIASEHGSPEGEVLALGAGTSINDDRHWRSAGLSRRTPALISNALVRSADVLARLEGPIIACVMDIKFVGASRLAGQYLADLTEFLAARPDRWVATSEFCAPMLRPRLPQALRPRILVVPMETPSGPTPRFKLDLFRDTSVVDNWNVGTTLVLPLAASLARSIVIAGFDGRANPDRNEFWQGISYGEMEDSVLKALGRLPSENSPEIYAAHIANIDRMIVQMREEGWSLRSLTPSFFPSVDHLYTATAG